MAAFLLFMLGAWVMLSLISNRNTTQAEERLDRIGRPKSLADIELSQQKSKDRCNGVKDAVSSLGSALEPQSELENSNLKIKLANAGFRSETAAAVYQGLRMA